MTITIPIFTVHSTFHPGRFEVTSQAQSERLDIERSHRQNTATLCLKCCNCLSALQEIRNTPCKSYIINKPYGFQLSLAVSQEPWWMEAKSQGESSARSHHFVANLMKDYLYILSKICCFPSLFFWERTDWAYSVPFSGQGMWVMKDVHVMSKF